VISVKNRGSNKTTPDFYSSLYLDICTHRIFFDTPALGIGDLDIHVGMSIADSGGYIR
jgi:hypothetical protein